MTSNFSYTPNSFGQSFPEDEKMIQYDPYAPDFIPTTNYNLLDVEALNNADISDIVEKPITTEIFNDDKEIPKKYLTDEVSKNIYGNSTNEQSLYYDYINGKIDKKLYYEFLERLRNNKSFNVSGTIESEKFWLEDPSVLYSNYTKFFPSKNMSKIEILNALTRFMIYWGIIQIVVLRIENGLLLPLIGIIIIIVLYYYQKYDKNDVLREELCRGDQCENIKLCQKPSMNNPFMNVTMADLMDNRDRPEACQNNDEETKKFFDYNLFKNVDDFYDKSYSQRQFYTMPSTTIPNDQTGFAKWLYDLPKTCKENQENCLRYEDIRFNRFNPDIDKFDRSLQF